MFVLHQALQQKFQFQDAVYSYIYSIGRELIENLRSRNFCKQHDTEVPDFSTIGHPHHLKDHITPEHHSRVEIVLAGSDKHLQLATVN